MTDLLTKPVSNESNKRAIFEKNRSNFLRENYHHLWARVGVSFYLTDEEYKQLCSVWEKDNFFEGIPKEVIAQKRFLVDGDSYIPEGVLSNFFDKATNYTSKEESLEIDTCLFNWYIHHPEELRKEKHYD